MNFELEFPYDDDTVYLAYSRPYQYSQVLAHMLHVEHKLLQMTKAKMVRGRRFSIKI